MFLLRKMVTGYGQQPHPPKSTDLQQRSQELGAMGLPAPSKEQVKNAVSGELFVGNLGHRRRLEKAGIIKDLTGFSINDLRIEIKVAMEQSWDTMQDLHESIQAVDKEVEISSELSRHMRRSCYSYNCLQNSQEAFERVLRYLNIVDLVRNTNNRARIYLTGSRKPRPRKISFGDYYTFSKKKSKNGGHDMVEIFSPTAPPVTEEPPFKCNFIKQHFS